MEKAANLTFLSSDGVANTPALYIACTTTHAAIAIPANMQQGKFCKFINESSTTTDFVDFFFSFNASAEVDRAVASSVSGAQSPKLGDRLYGTQSAQGRMPYNPKSLPLYLIVESSASLNLRVTLTEQ